MTMTAKKRTRRKSSNVLATVHKTAKGLHAAGAMDRRTIREFDAVCTPEITRGTKNVFADLGFTDAEERQTKLRLAYAINTIVEERKLTQAEAAQLLRVTQPKVSALVNYGLDGFSVERLMMCLTALDRDVQIVIKKKPRSRASGRISVDAA